MTIETQQQIYKENIEKRKQTMQQPENKAEQELLTIAAEVHGEQKAIELFDKMKAEAFAETILSREDYLYAGSYEKHREKIEELGEKALSLSQKYKAEKEKINSNDDLSDSGKINRIEQLFKTYREQVEGIIMQQRELEAEYAENRHKIARTTLESIENNASIADFTEKDMQYILYMIDRADNALLLGVLEEYNFNPFLIKMINARDSKLTKFSADGQFNASKLVVEHPLKHVMNAKNNSFTNQLQTKYRTHNIAELIPVDGVASIDPWASSTKSKMQAQ